MVSDESGWKKSGIATKFPTYRNSKLITVHSWLAGKREDDGAEGLWRIYDSIYDLTEFIHKHPGGSFWLRESKGTDITEAFEAHHMSTRPAKMLDNFKVRDAAKPRIYTLTLNDNGFYKTLKSRVRETLKNVDYAPVKRTNVHNLELFLLYQELIYVTVLLTTVHTQLGLLLSIFLFSIASARLNSLLYLILAGVAICWCAITAHNYFHKKDNWQMYTFNLSMMNYCAWRVSHVFSHHVYPNSLFDLELAMFEPFLCWLPNEHFKSMALRYVSWLTEPITYVIAFMLQMVTRIIYSFKHTNIMYWHDLISLSIPLSMFVCSDLSLLMCLRQWIFMTMIASLTFCIIGLNAAHHDPEIYHDGDANRPDRDWGLFQVDTIIDRGDLKGSQFMVLTHFGDHALHHLFPTLDHGILPQLYPVLYETLEEFKGHLRECNHLQHILGQHKQLLRTKPNSKPPGSGK